MAGILYFFDRLTRGQLAPGGLLALSILRERGLDQVLADVLRVPADAALVEITGRGPGGASGLILAPHPVNGEPAPRIGYYPEFQAWEQAGERLWLGIDKEHPPTPADLARRQQFEGYPVELAGATWKIPVVRNCDGGTQLGKTWRCLPGGEVQERIKAQYRALWDEFAAVVELFFDPEDPSPVGTFKLDLPVAMRHCLAAIGLNYRVGPFEQNLLGLVDNETWAPILAAAVDVHGFWDVFTSVQQSKKKRATVASPAPPPGSDATGPGGPAPCPATAPAAESSNSCTSATDP